MSNKLVKNSNLGDLSYSDLGLDVSFQILEAPYLEDGTKMLFKIDDVENFCAYNSVSYTHLTLPTNSRV